MFLSQTTAALPPIDDPQNQSLVAAPNKVEKIMIGYAKKAKNQEKQLIFGHFQLYPLLLRNYAKISSFSWFLAFLA